MTTTIALGIATALDTATARQLHDYGDLDDAGVAAALEQTGLQRHGALRSDGYLSRIRQVGIVVDDKGDISVDTLTAETSQQEAGLLEALFAAIPDSAGTRCFVWTAAEWLLLRQRAFRHQLQAPAPVYAGSCEPLCQWLVDTGTHEPMEELRNDALKLYGTAATTPISACPVLGEALCWYHMALRQKVVSGALDAAALEQRMAEAIGRATGLCEEAAS